VGEPEFVAEPRRPAERLGCEHGQMVDMLRLAGAE
jgi:hypothetical protein